MAGVVAMASVIEDFETQPCKKSRKDAEGPATKTITNYFSPVPKPAEKKPFSPPRSNNIMDYFSRKKTPPAREKDEPPPERSKESHQGPRPPEAPGAPENAAKQPAMPPPQKRGRKPSKAARRLAERAEAAGPAEDCVIVVEEERPREVEEKEEEEKEKEEEGRAASEETVVTGCGVLGSDTAALLARISAEGRSEKSASGRPAVERDDEEEVSKGGPSTEEGKRGKTSGSPASKPQPQSGRIKRAKAAATKPRRGKAKQAQEKGEEEEEKEKKEEEKEEEKEEGRRCGPEAGGAERTLRDVGTEDNADEASPPNASTVTISFEDFLQSQGGGKKEEDKEEEGSRVGTEPAREREAVVPDGAPKAGGGAPQVSPRTLTVRAEVHAISPPDRKPAGVKKKVASIFARRKEEGGGSSAEAKPASSSSPRLLQAGAPAEALPKRKSNVVLQEEDLELAVVVESESTPKCCSQAERKQFMSAFKQPGKVLGRQKQPAEEKKAPEEEEEEEKKEEAGKAGENSGSPAVEQPPGAGDTGATKKPGGRGRKKARREQPAPGPVTQEEPVTETGKEEEPAAKPDPEDPTTITVTTPARRSKRELPPRRAPVAVDDEGEAVTPVPRRTRRRREDAAAPPVMLSPPKTPRSKHGVYRALMLSPPDESGSPIRMKFTRVFPSSTSKSGAASDLLSTGPATKGSNASKKRKRAMKLVEKARAIQQNKKASAEEKARAIQQNKKASAEEKARAIQQNKKASSEEKGSLRRSSRSQPSTKTSYCQDEDSVVFLEEDQTAQEKKSKAQRGLRSLNDVLGKPTAPSKETKNSAGSKVTPMFVGKKAQRPSSVISILDESSLEGSEDGSQDGSEQSRARRDFLKSGLPESFKKQIAKTVAVKEAYSVSCSSFQPVVHVLQTAQDCPLWTLPWPVSPLLRCLKEFRSPAPNPLPSPKDPGLSPGRKTAPAARVHSERGSGWREEFSDEARRLLALEVSSSNPTFPVQRFLTRFLKRRAHHALQCSAPEPDPAPEAPVPPATAEGAGGKRKRVDEGGDAAKVAKKPRSGRSEEETPAAVPAAAVVPDDPFATPSPEQPPRRRRGRPPGRAQRHTQQEEEMEVMEVEAADPAVQTTPLSSRRETRDAPVIVLGDSPPSTTGKEELVREDVLWTEKYQPQHSGEVIGNTASVRRLHSWLKEWKLRVDREEKQQRQDRKQEEDSSDSWACGEGGPEEEEELMCNTLLITGPSGSGKTASVYACALELGFKVFEVNASSQRSGRQILSQLKEATQSHQVDVRGVSAHKPAYFSSSSARLGSSPRRVNSPRRAASSPRKAPQSPRGPRRGGLAPTSLAGFFKMGRPPGRERANPPDKTQQTVAPKKTTKAKEGSITKTKDAPPKPAARAKESSSGKTKDPPVPKPAAGAKTPSSQEPSKKAATSLILFEEVDVIFDDDWGFLAAIKTFMATTKRPVVLTTSDPTFGAMFDGYFEEIHFRTPSVVNVGSYLRLVCLAENMRTDAEDVSSLLRLTGCDVRQSLLHLQFWTRSSGGRQTPRPLPPSVEAAETLKKNEGSVAADAASVRKAETKAPAPLPPCDTACTESMLGMLNAEPERDVLDLLKSCSTADPACWDLLRASRRRGVDLLYSNMEALLPLPVTLLPLPVTLLPLPVTALTTTATRVAEAAARTQERRKEEEEEEETAGHAPPPLDRLLRAAEGSEGDGSPLKLSSGMRRRKRRQQQRGGGPDDHDPFHSDSDSDESAFLSLCRPPGEGSRRVGGDGEPAPASAAAPTRMRRAPPPLTPEQRMKSAPVSRCLGSLAQFLDHMSLLDAMTTPLPPCPGGEWAWLGLSGGGVEVKDGMTDEPREGPECAGGRWAERERGLEIQAALEGLSFQRCRAGAEEAWALGRGLGEGPGGEEEAREELSLPVAPHRRGFSLTPDGPCEPKATQRRREVMDAVLSSRACGALGSRRAVAMDYLPALRAVCRAEQLKEQGKTKRRFLHYLTSISLGLPKSALQSLAEDFP